MDEQKQFIFVNHFLPANEQQFLDKFHEVARSRNTLTTEGIRALANISLDDILDLVVGPSHIALIFKDGRVARLPFHAAMATAAAPSSAIPPPPQPSRASPAANNASSSVVARTAKFRRVMLATSSRRGADRSVIVDSLRRPLVPATSVPDDLIAQAQVVLQGRPREQIVRELQRTNLNVNEAVNNLLSRDDDEEEGSDGGGASEVCLPEELLSLLDASHGGLLDSDALYAGADGFEYLLSGRERRRGEKEKEKSRGGGAPGSAVVREGGETPESSVRRYEISNPRELQFWDGDRKTAVEGESAEGGMRFVKIAANSSELLGLGRDGRLYGWEWRLESGSTLPHPMNAAIGLEEEEELVELTSCSQRVAVMSRSNRVATWIDHLAAGERLTQALLCPLAPLALGPDEQVVQLFASNQFAAVRLNSNSFYWCGMYPLAERRRLFEKIRSKLRKHVTFDTTEIVVGSEVRMKSGPIYSTGCIAVNLNGPTPLVGVLMEQAWSLSEVCRFRVLEPADYDKDRPVVAVEEEKGEEEEEDDEEELEVVIAKQALATGNRKRPAGRDVFNDSPTPQKETPWPIAEIIFIHEEQRRDTAVVKIVDGPYCALEYQKNAQLPSDVYATSFSGKLAREGDKRDGQEATSNEKIRLIRKDELTVVTPKLKSARSPLCLKGEPTRFAIAGSMHNKKIVSAVADSMAVRLLLERRSGSTGQLAAHMMRLSIGGRILSLHSLPLHAPALHEGDADPKLINYGDDSVILLRDGAGGVQPLLRDALSGFRAPAALQMPAGYLTAVGIAPVAEKDRPANQPKVQREAIVVTLTGSHPRTLEKRMPSLMQTVLYTDVTAAKQMLDKLYADGDMDVLRREIVDSRSDGSRNILHVAVMHACALNNRNEADIEQPSLNIPPEDRHAAQEHMRTLDQRWQRMLRSNAKCAATDGQQASSLGIAPPSESAQFDDPMTGVVKLELEDADEFAMAVKTSPVESARSRQLNSIEMAKMLVTHRACIEHLPALLAHRDLTGLTPFQCAVNVRAYTAARALFSAICTVAHAGSGADAEKVWPVMQPYVFPAGSRPDDSPLFVLCYNDTCSFTWTGDEHINQDIFECRTCGLVGSLCCCTECAFTCHRNHDCKLKKTSPTAYCDCWEKCSCHALVAGNQTAREALLTELLESTSLYKQTNGRGEHVALFLARTLARQSNEQANHKRNRRLPSERRLIESVMDPGGSRAAAAAANPSVPEHNLEPPRFALPALLHCLGQWRVVRSIAMLGVRHLPGEQPVSEEVFHFNAQSGSTQIDKLIFALFSKCGEKQVMEELINTLARAINEAKASGASAQLNEAHEVLSRFVRSVLRLYLVSIVLSPSAAAAAVSGDTRIAPPSSGSSQERVRTINFSGYFQIVRRESVSACRDGHKHKTMAAFVVRCRAFLAHFAAQTAYAAAQLADALLAPVRTGICRPVVCLAAAHSNSDNPDVLEKYLNSENDLTALLGVSGAAASAVTAGNALALFKDEHSARRRKRFGSRRETEREEGEEREGREQWESDGSDSDSEVDVPSVRRFTSQSSTADPSSATERTGTDARRGRISSTGSRRQEDGSASAVDDDLSTDQDDEEDESSRDRGPVGDDEEDEEEEDEEEEEHDDLDEDDDPDAMYDNSEGEADITMRGEDQQEGDDQVDPESSGRIRGNVGEGRERIEGEEEGSGPFSPSSPNYALSDEDGNARDGEAEDKDGEEGVEDAVVIEGVQPVDDAAAAGLQQGEVPPDEESTRDAVHSGSSATSSIPAMVEPVAVAVGGDQAVDQAALDAARDFSDDGTAARSRVYARRSRSPIRFDTGTENGAAGGPPSGLERPRGANATTGSAYQGWALRRMGSSGASWRRDEERGRRPEGERITYTSATSATPNNNDAPPSSAGTAQPAATTSSATAADATGGRLAERVTQPAREDETPTQLKAEMQLATAFAFCIRLVNEMGAAANAEAAAERAGERERVAEKTEDGFIRCTALLTAEAALLMQSVADRLKPSWNWLEVVLDRAEAQLKYANALSQVCAPQITAAEQRAAAGRGEKGGEGSSSGAGRRKHSNARGTGNRATDDVPLMLNPHQQISLITSAGPKREAFELLFGVMRCHSAENGDDIPSIDFEALRPVAIVADAYISYVTMLRKMDRDAEARQLEEAKKIAPLRHFYLRSNSVSYAGMSYTDAHDTLAEPVAGSLPLVERPHLLTPAADKEAIFGAPMAARTPLEHRKLAGEHGLEWAAHQSLAAPARPYAQVIHAAECGREESLHGGEEEEQMETGGASPEEEMPEAPEGFEPISLDCLKQAFQQNRNDSIQKLFGRWRNILSLMAKEMHSDLLSALGGSSSESALLAELGGFPLRQSLFRRRVDRFRANVTKDVSLDVHRDQPTLVRDTVFQLNRLHMRRVAQNGAGSGGGGGSGRGGEKQERTPPLAAAKVKVKFHEEPGEGTGVARSFYTALAEALQQLRSFPFAEFGWAAPNDDWMYGGPAGFITASGGAASVERPNAAGQAGRSRLQVIRGREAALFAASRRKGLGRRIPLNFLNPPYTPANIAASEALPDTAEALLEAEMEMSRSNAIAVAASLAQEQRGAAAGGAPGAPQVAVGGHAGGAADDYVRLPASVLDRLFIKVRALQPAAAARITGMLAELPSAAAIVLLQNPDVLKGYVTDAVDMMVNNGATSDLSLLRANDDSEKTLLDKPDEEQSGEPDDAPLFFRASKRAFFSPVPGRLSPMRLTAFRNVGRVMGLCLSQCELFPLRISRHVLKFILGRPINWHDLAFYDPQMFESLRAMIMDGHDENLSTYFDDLQLAFTHDLPAEVVGRPGGMSVDLAPPGGSSTSVTRATVIQYVYKVVEARLLGPATKCLHAIRQGVLDVIPASLLENLTAEDLRLILCGTETVSMSLMQSYTTFADESHASPETMNRFKTWFWQVADRLSSQEKQELIFFWTGSPSLPSNEESFQPKPTVVIRPPDDNFLPTANTCISRLYLPLYTSKRILAAKLQLAIKAKNFGFV